MPEGVLLEASVKEMGASLAPQPTNVLPELLTNWKRMHCRQWAYVPLGALAQRGLVNFPV